MPNVERVTVALPDDLAKHGSREQLRRSLRNPHPESARLADQGLEEWARGLPEEDTETLLEGSVGTAVRWIPGDGWVEDQGG